MIKINNLQFNSDEILKLIDAKIEKYHQFQKQLDIENREIIKNHKEKRDIFVTRAVGYTIKYNEYVRNHIKKCVDIVREHPIKSYLYLNREDMKHLEVLEDHLKKTYNNEITDYVRYDDTSKVFKYQYEKEYEICQNIYNKLESNGFKLDFKRIKPFINFIEDNGIYYVGVECDIKTFYVYNIFGKSDDPINTLNNLKSFIIALRKTDNYYLGSDVINNEIVPMLFTENIPVTTKKIDTLGNYEK